MPLSFKSSLHTTRKIMQLPDEYTGITLYADVSQATVHARKKLISDPKAFCTHKIAYRWKFPNATP